MTDNPFQEEKEETINPFASSIEGGLERSTFSRHGKLSLNTTVPCTRCARPFIPDSNTVRLHNRSELFRLLCEKCTKRDNELMCASAKLMITKGGFPPTIEQLINAFFEKDEALVGKDMADPFEKLRSEYEHRPLCDEDIRHWVHEKYFVLNRHNHQLECMIDKVMDSPDRTLLLGKEGLEGKKMAARRSQRLETDKKPGKERMI